MKDNEIQEVDRQNVINYCKENGVKYCFVASRIGVSKSLISHWLKGRRNLNNLTLELLDKYLKQ